MTNEIKVNNFGKDIKTLKKEVKEVTRRRKDFYRTSDACCPHLDSIAYNTYDCTIEWAVEYGTDYASWHNGYIVLPRSMYVDTDIDGNNTINIDKLTEKSIINYVKKVMEDDAE